MNLRRLRTPIIFTSLILWGILLIHLVWVYIYEGGSTKGVPWGSINIGMVGESPGIPNPLKYGQNKQTDLILSFLFRSLLHYDDTTGGYGWDIANCDISDLAKVSCTIKEGWLWSDGTKIQVDDVIASIQAFRGNPPNEKMQGFLAGVSVVSKKDGFIEIIAKERNSLMLDLLSYPILRSDMIERIRTERLSDEAYITSGSYVFLEREKNAQYGYDRVTIGKNVKNPGKWWLDKYNFLFFPDAGSLERWADNLSIIVPPLKQEKMLLGPRFASYEYTLFEYLGLFLNTDRVRTDIRKHIILQMQSSISWSVVRSERPVEDLFSDGSTGSPIKLEKNLADVLSAGGYVKPDDRASRLEKETGLLTGSSIAYENNVFIDSPSKKNIAFTEVADGTMTISGKVPGWVKSVSINGYTLIEFAPWNPRFSYKVSLEAGTLSEGKNIYTLEFETFTEVKSIKDTLTLYYYRDSEKLTGTKNEVEKEYLAKLNTPELVSKRLQKVNELKTKIQALDPRYYYDESLSPFELEIVYLGEPASLQTYASKVSEALTSLSIKTKIRPISSKDLTEMLKKWEKDYDGIIVGFEANGHFSRIAQIFLSTEAKNGINFAKIESKNLDALFAAFRISYTEEKTKEIRKQIQNYLRSEAFFFPISSPIHTLYIDKNLKWIVAIDTFQDITTLYNAIYKASIKEDYILHTEWKGVGGFLSWIFSKAMMK